MPLLFRDVIKVACSPGISYIWIDRLCIIQGDDKDFRSQARKMGEAYGNATLTIATASATWRTNVSLFHGKINGYPSTTALNSMGLAVLKPDLGGCGIL